MIARWWRNAVWVASLGCFVAGFAIGMLVHPQWGAALWVASAFLALVPFSAHRARL